MENKTSDRQTDKAGARGGKGGRESFSVTGNWEAEVS